MEISQTKSPFKVSGKERRVLKKKYNKIKSFLKGFWHDHNMDKDMTSFYGGGTDTFPMSDEKAQNMYDKNKNEMERLEKILNEPC